MKSAIRANTCLADFFVLLRNHKRRPTMASNPDFVQYIADQCAGAGEITVKKMFGDYGFSRNSCYRTYGHRCAFN